jgi:hypothetical protein
MNRLTALFTTLSLLLSAAPAIADEPEPDADAVETAPTTRRVSISGSMFTLDHETGPFEQDETETMSFAASEFIGLEHPQSLVQREHGVGGEVRIELSLQAQMLSNGDVRLTGTAILYEGNSESSGDRDGSATISIMVPKGQSVSHQFVVRNTDEGGDYSRISFTATNSDP